MVWSRDKSLAALGEVLSRKHRACSEETQVLCSTDSEVEDQERASYGPESPGSGSDSATVIANSEKKRCSLPFLPNLKTPISAAVSLQSLRVRRPVKRWSPTLDSETLAAGIGSSSHKVKLTADDAVEIFALNHMRGEDGGKMPPPPPKEIATKYGVSDKTIRGEHAPGAATDPFACCPTPRP